MILKFMTVPEAKELNGIKERKQTKESNPPSNGVIAFNSLNILLVITIVLMAQST